MKYNHYIGNVVDSLRIIREEWLNIFTVSEEEGKYKIATTLPILEELYDKACFIRLSSHTTSEEKMEEFLCDLSSLIDYPCSRATVARKNAPLEIEALGYRMEDGLWHRNDEDWKVINEFLVEREYAYSLKRGV